MTHPDCRLGCWGRKAAADRPTPRRWERRWWTGDVSIGTCNHRKFESGFKWHFGPAVRALYQDKEFVLVCYIFPLLLPEGDNPELWSKTCQISTLCSGGIQVSMATKDSLSLDISRRKCDWNDSGLRNGRVFVTFDFHGTHTCRLLQSAKCCSELFNCGPADCNRYLTDVDTAWWDHPVIPTTQTISILGGTTYIWHQSQ